jgi:hypothetical protein
MDTNLAAGHTYRYRIIGRDSSQNETGYFEIRLVTTTGEGGTPADQEDTPD